MKTCPQCGKPKPLDEYRTRKVKGRTYPAPYCNPCTREYQRQRRRERLAEGWEEPRRSTAEQTRTSWLRRLQQLGITEDEYLGLLEIQGGQCAICKADQPWSRSTTWHVDHDHITGEVRGLLCSRCNRGLGYFRDDPALLNRAIDYLHQTPYSHLTAATFTKI